MKANGMPTKNFDLKEFTWGRRSWKDIY